MSVREFWTDWTTSKLWARPSESTNVHNRERSRRRSCKSYGDRPIATIGPAVVSEWLRGGSERRDRGRASGRCSPTRAGRKAGMLVAQNPFAGLGLRHFEGSQGDPAARPGPRPAAMIAAADELTPPSFAAYVLTACWSAARPGELDALQWDDLDFMAETIRYRAPVERQGLQSWTPPKHGSRRTVAMTEPVRERLERLPRESEWVFTTIRGTHYTASSRAFHWNAVRAAAGLGGTSLYLATRHFYGWYALNVLELPPHVIALQLGHTDGGRLVRELYGHPDAALARKRTRDAFRSTAPAVGLPRAS